jgi:aminoglycoside phosphotransferase (APT) family kinase protein
MTPSTHPDGRAGIDASLVKRLVAAQFPQWAGLAVTPVEVDGWDNRTYRLGDQLTVRLPTAAGYAPAVDKEQRWLPVLAPCLPVAVPEVLARGVPAEGYPYNWSIRRWLPGRSAGTDRIADLPRFAEAVAEFIVALQQIPVPPDAPFAGEHSFYRGTSLLHYDDETRRSIGILRTQIDADAALAVWDEALAATWAGPPRWFHGDIAEGNLLVSDGELAAVIDFGTSGVGDPACDLVIAWTLFCRAGRSAFHRAVGQDQACWARARGWALWKALITLAADSTGEAAAERRRLIEGILASPGA